MKTGAIIAAVILLIVMIIAIELDRRTNELPPCREGHWEMNRWVCDVRDAPPGMKISEPERRPMRRSRHGGGNLL